MLKLAGKFVGWLAILLVVQFAISTMTHISVMAGSGVGTGVFSYRFRARLDSPYDFEDEDSAIGLITIEATAPSRFKVWGHASPAYRKVEIDWILFQEEQWEGRATIDLDQMLIKQGRESLHLKQPHIMLSFAVES